MHVLFSAASLRTHPGPMRMRADALCSLRRASQSSAWPGAVSRHLQGGAGGAGARDYFRVFSIKCGCACQCLCDWKGDTEQREMEVGVVSARVPPVQSVVVGATTWLCMFCSLNKASAFKLPSISVASRVSAYYCATCAVCAYYCATCVVCYHAIYTHLEHNVVFLCCT